MGLSGALLVGVLAFADELKVEAKLIWGTNDEKYSNEKHKPVDKELATKLGNVFQWKRYFVVNRVEGVVPSRGVKQLKMSEQCTLEVKELEGPRVEVVLIGEGKRVNRTVENLSPGNSIVIAGPAKNKCAWFVVLSQTN
jgi:hypothetical protein